jgi:hypothetical protein
MLYQISKIQETNSPKLLPQSHRGGNGKIRKKKGWGERAGGKWKGWSR